MNYTVTHIIITLIRERDNYVDKTTDEFSRLKKQSESDKLQLIELKYSEV